MARPGFLFSAALFCLSTRAITAASAPEIAACSAAERQAYMDQLRQAVSASWTAPERMRAASCTVVITQNFRGEVLDARAEECTDDPLIQKSVEDAAYEASPLPTPADRACRERVIRLRLTHRTRSTD